MRAIFRPVDMKLQKMAYSFFFDNPTPPHLDPSWPLLLLAHELCILLKIFVQQSGVSVSPCKLVSRAKGLCLSLLLEQLCELARKRKKTWLTSCFFGMGFSCRGVQFDAAQGFSEPTAPRCLVELFFLCDLPIGNGNMIAEPCRRELHLNLVYHPELVFLIQVLEREKSPWWWWWWWRS